MTPGTQSGAVPQQQQQRPYGSGQYPGAGTYWQNPYQQRGYAIPNAAPGSYSSLVQPKKTDPKKVLYILAIALLLAGSFLVYKGLTAGAQKVSIRLETLAETDSAIVGIVCQPCGSTQETSLQQVVGKDNYKGTTKTQLGQEIMIAKATGAQVFTISEKDWVKYIDRIE